MTVKRLSTHSHVQCRAALREIRILRHLEHDNIVDMYDVLGLVDRESGELLSIYIVEVGIVLITNLLNVYML